MNSYNKQNEIALFPTVYALRLLSLSACFIVRLWGQEQDPVREDLSKVNQNDDELRLSREQYT